MKEILFLSKPQNNIIQFGVYYQNLQFTNLVEHVICSKKKKKENKRGEADKITCTGKFWNAAVYVIWVNSSHSRISGKNSR